MARQMARRCIFLFGTWSGNSAHHANVLPLTRPRPAAQHPFAPSSACPHAHTAHAPANLTLPPPTGLSWSYLCEVLGAQRALPRSGCQGGSRLQPSHPSRNKSEAKRASMRLSTDLWRPIVSSNSIDARIDAGGTRKGGTIQCEVSPRGQGRRCHGHNRHHGQPLVPLRSCDALSSPAGWHNHRMVRSCSIAR